ncbi:hypothetical protein BGX26_005446 [Mortierella sp. AD094]|nr:hypothetical protein BGX26_005446 [Mortierella sp. AD094]
MILLCYEGVYDVEQHRDVTIELELEQAITTKKKRDQTRNNGEHRRNDGDLMGGTQRHHHALDTEEISKETSK